MTETAAFSGCTIVMAHPDDEVLWASSILARAAQVVLCYGDVPSSAAISSGRRAAMAAFPLPTLRWLALAEAEAFGAAAWPDPVESPEGLALARHPGSARCLSTARYAANFALLREHLRTTLDGSRVVVTHNPWGEYGHEEHVQVFRAVDSLRAELGYDLWVSSYVSERSAGLARRLIPWLGAASASLDTDAALGDRLRTLYRTHGCWTWPDDYVWPEREVFFRWDGGAAPPRKGAVAPLNYILFPAPSRPSAATRLRRRVMRLARRVTGRS